MYTLNEHQNLQVGVITQKQKTFFGRVFILQDMSADFLHTGQKLSHLQE